MKEISLTMIDEKNQAPFKNITVKNTTYNLAHQIAKGHFSTIYKATDIWKNNLVVKIYDDKINEKLFDNEIKQLKRFASLNIVSLYEAFSYDKFHFLIMENFGVAISRIKTQDFDTKVNINEFEKVYNAKIVIYFGFCNRKFILFFLYLVTILFSSFEIICFIFSRVICSESKIS